MDELDVSQDLDIAKRMLDAISRIQKITLDSRRGDRLAFDELLDATIQVTSSEYGFIGEILLNEDGKRYLKSFTITNIAWNEETRAIYESNVEDGMEFHNLDTLFGQVMRTGEAVIANDAPGHSHAGGVPEGHPDLNAFLGIPLYAGEDLVGMVGVANRKQGYDQNLIDQCEPLFITMGNLINTSRVEKSRVLAEETLEATNARLNQAMEMSQIGYWDVDLVEGKVDWDPVTRSIHEVDDKFQPTLEDAIDFYAPGSREKVQAYVEKVIEEGHDFWFEEEIITAKGNHVWVRAMGRAVKKEDQIVAMSGVFQDITDSKQRELDLKSALDEAALHQKAEAIAQAALKSSEYRLQSAIEAGKLGIWSYKPAEDLMYASARWAEILGRPPFAATLNQKAFYELIHPDDKARVQQEIARHHRGETDGYTLDVRHQCADGTYKWLHAHGMVIEREEDGTPILVCGTIQDISDRKTLEFELEQLTRKLTIALETTSMGVWSLNIDTGELFWDEGMERLYGEEHKHGARVYEDWTSLVHPNDLEYAAKAVQDTIDSGVPYNITFRVFTPDGELRHFRGEAQRYELNPGEWHMIGVNVDITQDVLINQELKAQREEAEAANRAKSQFLANMSHEIRTPLNGILGMAQLLGRTHLDQTQKDYANTILTSGQNLLELIEDVLDISKIEAGQFDLQPEPFDLKDLIETTIKTLQGQAEAKSLNLEFDLDPELPDWVIGDRKRIRQVLINLIGNALKFTSNGYVHLKVYPDVEDTISFEVTDTGPGIELSQQSIIFDRFAQADGSKTRVHGDAGLGLAICKEITILSGGTIGVDSKPGKGSTFRFCVPLPERGSDSSEHYSALPGHDEKVGEGKRVLVAEDNAVNRAVASGMLRGAGYEVFEAENGRIALEMIQSRKPQAILLDLHMPEMNGDDVLNYLNADPDLKRIPVLLLSADATPESRNELLAKGVKSYFTKPLDLQAVLQRLNEVMSEDLTEERQVS